ncbi:MAG: hypothetical protein N0E44_20105 [Candidatus Thiodiazotropha lotti]|nr:hypothetical protein [Candidatus Thiodiazotropha lotti]MCW4222181.1 hypothetical protein [Candidatus Thiodiazotropha lotti]
MKLTPAALQAAVDGDFENLRVATTPGGIEAQEAQGQKDFATSQTLPKDCPRVELEKLGFVFGDDADDLFVNVVFPEGWAIRPTDHAMHSDLLDNKGRKRAAIFYKAAFYDRNADLSLTSRFSFGLDYGLEDAVQCVIFDCGKEVRRTEKVECERYSGEYWAASKLLKEAAMEWLNNEYPEWQDALAYWD